MNSNVSGMGLFIYFNSIRSQDNRDLVFSMELFFRCISGMGVVDDDVKKNSLSFSPLNKSKSNMMP